MSQNRTEHQRKAVPLSERVKVRSDAKPVEVECPICGEVQKLLASVAKGRKTCGKKQCTAELKRRNARSQAGSLSERMNSKFAKRDSGCWEWIGAKNQAGYGVLVVGRKSLLAHRLSYVMHKGRLDQGALVCHHCDNPCCVNPEHLYAGDDKTNAFDRMSRGRYVAPAGELNGISKLTDEAVSEIRRAWAEGGLKQKELAEIYDVSPSLISKVVNGHIWGHVNDEA